MEFKFLNSDSLKWEAIIHIVKMFNVDYIWSERYCSINIKTENIFIVHTLNSVYNRFVVQDEPIVI